MNLFKTGISFEFSKFANVTFGKKFSCRRNVQLSCEDGATLFIGDNVFINTNSVVACHKLIKIGNNVKFGPNTYIYDHDHTYLNGKITHEYKVDEIIIDDDVWVGANCVILKGTHIGKQCVFGAGCIIKGDYPPYSFIVQKRESQIRSFEEFTK